MFLHWTVFSCNYAKIPTVGSTQVFLFFFFSSRSFRWRTLSLAVLLYRKRLMLVYLCGFKCTRLGKDLKYIYLSNFLWCFILHMWVIFSGAVFYEKVKRSSLIKCSLFIDRRSQQCSTILFIIKRRQQQQKQQPCFFHKPFCFGFFQCSLWTLYPVVNNYTTQQSVWDYIHIQHMDKTCYINK